MIKTLIKKLSGQLPVVYDNTNCFYSLAVDGLNDFEASLNSLDSDTLSQFLSQVQELKSPSSRKFVTLVHKINIHCIEILQYAYKGQDKYPASNLVMGVKDVVIERMYNFDDEVHIYGDNFTKWSKVYVNGNKVATGYKSGQCLTIDTGRKYTSSSVSSVQARRRSERYNLYSGWRA